VKHTRISRDENRTIAIAAVVDNAIVCRTRELGQSGFSAQFTFVDGSGTAIKCEDCAFGLSASEDASGRWLLAVFLKGETSLSHYVSADNCKSWKRIS